MGMFKQHIIILLHRLLLNSLEEFFSSSTPHCSMALLIKEKALDCFSTSVVRL